MWVILRTWTNVRTLFGAYIPRATSILHSNVRSNPQPESHIEKNVSMWVPTKKKERRATRKIRWRFKTHGNKFETSRDVKAHVNKIKSCWGLFRSHGKTCNYTSYQPSMGQLAGAPGAVSTARRPRPLLTIIPKDSFNLKRISICSGWVLPIPSLTHRKDARYFCSQLCLVER